MTERNHKKIILILLTVVTLLYTPQAVAWGDLTHYSINREAGMNANEELSASVAPDALIDFNYGSNFLDTFVHLELPDMLYGPLDYYMYNTSEDQNKWATGWMTHTIADRSSHGTYLEVSPYPDPDNYLSAAGADSLQDHLKAEFGGDILSYWLNQGIMPGDIMIFPDQVGAAIRNYDAYCGTNYSTEYDRERYLSSFEALQAEVFAEQIVIDYKQDKKIQFTDRALLIWAYRKYHEPYEKYYSYSVDDLRAVSRPRTSPQCRSLSGPALNNSVHAKIKINVGEQLIDNGLINVHKKFDEKNGSITMNFEKNVTAEELAGAYRQYLEKAYEKQTGRELDLQEDIKSQKIYITAKEIKKDYPELYQKLIEKRIIEENVPLIEYILSFLKQYII